MLSVEVFEGRKLITHESLDYIQPNYLRETVIKHPQRAEAERIWNFPYAAIEEAVVNAVYHRSYEEREPIEVRITPDDLVVLSFPGPDRSIRMEDLRIGKAVSRRYRNRRIGDQGTGSHRGALHWDTQDFEGHAREWFSCARIRER